MTLDIMMPFYGRIDHFREAVESVLAQTDADWRLVVIDDAYPDRAAGEWLIGLGDERIEYVRNEPNLGINANFQRAIDLAVNDRLVIFGCDDIMLSGYVARVRELSREWPDATMIHPATEIIDSSGAVVRTLVDTVKGLYRPRVDGSTRLSGEQLAVSVTRGNWMNFPAVVWRRDLIAEIGFRSGFEVVQDLALVLDIAFRGGDLVIDDQVVFRYRRHETSVSSLQAFDGSRFDEERRFFAGIAREFDAQGWRRAARAARIHLSSRLNAVTRMPGAALGGSGRALATLARHALGS